MQDGERKRPRLDGPYARTTTHMAIRRLRLPLMKRENLICLQREKPISWILKLDRENRIYRFDLYAGRDQHAAAAEHAGNV